MTKLTANINAEIVAEYLDTLNNDGSQEALTLKKHLALLNVVEDTSHKAYIARQTLFTAVGVIFDLSNITDVFGNTLFSTGVKLLYIYKPTGDNETVVFNYNGANITLASDEVFIVKGAATIKQLTSPSSLTFTASGDTNIDLIIIGE